MNLSQIAKQLRACALNYATVISANHASLMQAKGILKVHTQINRLSERHIVFSKYNQFYEQHSGHNAASNKGIPECLIFGGILAFLGLDEDSKLERKYDKEIKGTKDEDFDEKLRNVLRPAIVNMQEGEYDKAEKVIHIALRMAQDVQHHDAILYIHDLLANLAYQAEDYKKAEKLFVDVMQRQIGYKGVAEDDNSIIAMSLRLAEIFAKTEEHEKAELGFEFCIESMEKKIQSGIRDEDTVVLWGMSRDLFGQYLMSVGKHEKARDQFKQAYEVSLEINGETDEQTLVLLNSLGTISATMGDAKGAEKYFQDLIYKARKNKSENLAHFLVNNGLVNIQLKLYDVAKRSCNEASTLSKRQKDGDAYEQSQNCLKILKETMSSNKE